MIMVDLSNPKIFHYSFTYLVHSQCKIFKAETVEDGFSFTLFLLSFIREYFANVCSIAGIPFFKGTHYSIDWQIIALTQLITDYVN